MVWKDRGREREKKNCTETDRKGRMGRRGLGERKSRHGKERRRGDKVNSIPRPHMIKREK